eukprot:GHVU01157235.1.p2 GENE.GHVU01157235.1~~GHVU01157235.1.p2  ORF type:complete len:103 (-),score=8.61 GHVU01157235.1:677-985(-)
MGGDNRVKTGRSDGADWGSCCYVYEPISQSVSIYRFLCSGGPRQRVLVPMRFRSASPCWSTLSRVKDNQEEKKRWRRKRRKKGDEGEEDVEEGKEDSEYSEY